MSSGTDGIDLVRRLITLLRSRAPMTEAERKRLTDSHFRWSIARMSKTGATYGEATEGRGIVSTTRDESEFKEALRSTDNDLARQVQIVREGVEDYFKSGIMPAPYYAWRIGIILRKAKEPELEADFLEAFSAHFRGGLGRRYQQISERAPKARALANRARETNPAS